MAKPKLIGTSTRTGVFTGGGITTQPVPPASTNTTGTARTTASPTGTQVNPTGGAVGGGVALNLGQSATSLLKQQQSRLAPLPVKIQQVARQNLLKNIYVDVKTTGQVKIINSQFVPVTNVGLSDFRPEILSVVNFLPIWERSATRVIQDTGKRYNSIAGTFLNFQFQTKSLRQETLTALIKNIKGAASQDPFVNIINEYNLQMQDVEKTLNIINNVYQNISIIKNSLEIKKIPVEAYEIIENNVPTQIPSIQEYFATRMNYRIDQYNIFSETKLMMQLIFDLSNMLQNYSVNLVSIIDNDRAIDNSPTSIDTSYEIDNAYTFNIKSLGNSVDIIKANDETYFNNFMSSLPAETDKKITLLTYILSKEYLVSNGLGDVKNQDNLSYFGIDRNNQTDLFFNIMGRPGSDIFDPPTSRAISTINNSRTKLSSLMYVDPNVANTRVLTLENKYIDNVNNSNSTKNVIYVPGGAYFTDAIVAVGGTGWNTKPYTDFATTFNVTVGKTISLIKSLLKLDVFDRAGNVLVDNSTTTQPSNISPSSFNSKILQTLYSSFDNLSTQEESYLSSFSNKRSDFENIISLNRRKKLAQEILDQLIVEGRGRAISAGETAQSGAEAAILSPAGRAAIIEIEYIEEQLTAIQLPPVTSDIKVLFDQSVLVALFKLASTGTATIKLKRLLYQYCVLAGFCTNKFYVGTGIFSLLANTEFKLAGDLIPEIKSQLGEEFSIGDTLCVDGQALSTAPLTTLVDLILSEIKSIFLGLASPGDRQNIPGNAVLQFNLTETELKEMLINCALGNGPSANNNMVAYFIKLANEIFNSSQINGVNVQLDASNRTRYNSLSISTQLLFLFEILSQYATKYSAWSFANYSSFEYYVLKLKYNDNTSIQTAFQNMLNEIPETEKQNLREANVYYKALEDNSKRISEEFTGIRNGLGIWQIVNNQIQIAANTIINFFNQTEIQNFLKTSNPNILGLLQNSSQARLAFYIYQDIKERGAATNSLVFNNGGTQATGTDIKEKELIVSNTVIPSEYNALTSLFSTQLNDKLITYPTNEINSDVIKRTNKIVTVGIPSGMSRQLADRVSIEDIQRLGIQDKQSDVIYVNIYPSDLRFEQIIFKPYRYIFDLSLFITKKNILDLNATNVENYSNLIDRINLTDFENIYSPKNVVLTDIVNDSRYNFLSEAQKREMVSNHLTSYLFDLYVNLLTGTRVNEEVYLSPTSNKMLTEKTFTAIKNYIKQIGEEPPLQYGTTEEILADPVLSSNVKDIIRLMTYGSLVFNESEVRKLVTTPKLFERTLNIPVNLDTMEVDLIATLKTAAGQASVAYILSRPELRNQFELRNGVPFLVANNPDSFIMKTLMVAVETVVSSRQQPTRQFTPNAAANRLTSGR